MIEERDEGGAALNRAERDLVKAEIELSEAKEGVAQAEADIGKAERELEEAESREFKVNVLYNGVRKSFEVQREELVKTLLEKAVSKFGPIPQPHTMALYNEHGDELADALTLKAAGVKPHDELLLRPSKVKGGNW